MKNFFQVTAPDDVIAMANDFSPVKMEKIPLNQAHGRVLGMDFISPEDLPGFTRATMDGYAVKASSTFGASESGPAFLTIAGSVTMGDVPGFSVGPGQAARISTGAMLPDGTDAVVMIEHTQVLDDTTIEAYKSVAPGQHVILSNEDIARDQPALTAGTDIRSQEVGLLAALGCEAVTVFKKPVVSIISTGDEIVAVGQPLPPGKIRDVNAYTLAGFVTDAGGEPVCLGIVEDDFDKMLAVCRQALSQSDMVLISGGSSMGTRDLTVQVLAALPDTEVLVHGISISPGKPTILARAGNQPFWGLPGQITSAMVAFTAVVRPFVDRLAGRTRHRREAFRLSARLTRNVASVQGRVDYVRVRLEKRDDGLWAEPILGKSGLISTMVKADGLVAIGMHVEGMEKGDPVDVIAL
ncbi:MAG: molybdopterin molybdenumtransferase MoeA [Deltaproteobacteria bacterium]|nr:MAG: molybdopterin molybdenumtransferase MoeA [Deltaproteobacteria bacterium]